jgi:uncharacterized protein (DUF1778 family)
MGLKMDAMQVTSLRIEPEILERCDWAAAARGITRSDFVRNALRNATRDEKPPADQESSVIRGSAAERESWAAAARARGESLEQFTRSMLNRASEYVLGNARPDA